MSANPLKKMRKLRMRKQGNSFALNFFFKTGSNPINYSWLITLNAKKPYK